MRQADDKNPFQYKLVVACRLASSGSDWGSPLVGRVCNVYHTGV
jgi:hypothetical protein